MSTKYYSDSQQMFAPRRKISFILEGRDDAYFVSRVLDYLGADSSIVGVYTMGGLPNIEKYVTTTVVSPDYSDGSVDCVAFIIDADKSFSKAERTLVGAMRILGWNGENACDFSKNENNIIICGYILPDFKNDGDLESLLLGTVVGDEIHGKSIEFFDFCKIIIKKDGILHRGSEHKRISQIYLAGKSTDLSRGVGQAFYDGAFEIEHASMCGVVDFIKRVISCSSE